MNTTMCWNRVSQVVGSRETVELDLRLLSSGQGAPVVENISSTVEVLHVAGPNSYKLVGQLNPEIVNIPFLASAVLDIAGVECRIFRVSFTGELGYEIHCPIESAPHV
jgi:glycine cleavage system aminomethyltransferase T